MSTPLPIRSERSTRTFRCVESGTDHYLLLLIHDGEIHGRVSLTATELRALSDTVLRALGWTPVDYVKTPE